MDGMVLVDKPTGITSGECVRRVRKILEAEKAGHSGSLDRNASGILLVALGKGVKSLGPLMGLDKEYEGVVHFHQDIDSVKLREAARGFRGTIEQTPPKRSAVVRRARIREVYSLDILKVSGRDAYFRVRVQAGTYIRRIAEGIGNALGVRAHLKSLRRTGLGPFTLRDCKPPEGLGKGDVLTVKSILSRTGKE